MREALSAAMSSSNLKHEEFECATDRLGALAFSDQLGSAMLWVLFARQRDKLSSVIVQLSERLKGATSTPEYCMPLATLAIYERMFPRCRSCKGATHQKNQYGVLVQCVTCVGTGNHHYSEKERAELIGLSWRPRYDRLMTIADSLLSGGELGAIAEVRRQLERE